MNCILCGGDHHPGEPSACDPDGIDREIQRMGARLWNRISGQVMRPSFKKLLQEMRDQKGIEK